MICSLLIICVWLCYLRLEWIVTSLRAVVTTHIQFEPLTCLPHQALFQINFWQMGNFRQKS